MTKSKSGLLAIFIFFALAALVFVPTWCLRQANTNLQTIEVATSKNAWCTLTLVALDLGLFEKHSLSARASYNAAGRVNMDALLSGSADTANIVEMNIANAAYAGETDLLVLGRVVRSWDYAFVFEPGVDDPEPEELIGKRIGFAPGTGAEPFLLAFLRKHNIDVDQVTLVRIPPTGLVEAYLAGEYVEVAVTWEPFVNTIRERRREKGGGEVRILRDREAFKGIMTLAVRRHWAEQNPSILQSLVAVYEEAAEFVAQNPDKSRAIVARKTGLPAELVDRMWERFEFGFVQDDLADRLTVQEAADILRRTSQNGDLTIDFHRYFKPGAM